MHCNLNALHAFWTAGFWIIWPCVKWTKISKSQLLGGWNVHWLGSHKATFSYFRWNMTFRSETSQILDLVDYLGMLLHADSEKHILSIDLYCHRELIIYRQRFRAKTNSTEVGFDRDRVPSRSRSTDIVFDRDRVRWKSMCFEIILFPNANCDNNVVRHT